MKENDELTSEEFREKLSKECGVEVSATTIRRVKHNVLGWKSENARYCQFVREPNKMKRLDFSLNAMVNKDQFEDVIFTMVKRTPKTPSEAKCPEAYSRCNELKFNDV